MCVLLWFCKPRSKKNLLEEGIEKAKLMLTGIFKMVQTSLDMQMVVSAGPFLYLVIQEVSSIFDSF